MPPNPRVAGLGGKRPFAATQPGDGVAPTPGLPALASERGNSTHTEPSVRRVQGLLRQESTAPRREEG
jgi:hypothetical protein